jgi:tRNA(Ile)-lysidine synthase
LAAIAPASKGIIRPFLDITRAEIEDFLHARNIPWREDATNLDPHFARNRIRHELLPQLAREWNPQIKETLARMADLAHEEEFWWASEIDRIAVHQLVVRPLVGRPLVAAAASQAAVLPANHEVELPNDVLRTLPRALARRLIRRAITLAKGDLRRIDFDHVEAIFDLHRTLRLPGLIVTRSFDWLLFAPLPVPAPPGPLEITPPGAYPSPDGLSQICVDLAQADMSDACANLKVEACQVCSPLQLRGWRPGDRYRPRGQSRDQKIQEMFQKARVPSWRRAFWPILTCGDRILWSRQFGVAEEFAGLLRITERPPC